VPHGRGHCLEHYRQRERERSRRRRADAERGKRVALYHRKRWKTTREAVLRRDPICKVCNVRLSEQVDHIVPLSQGGAGWDSGNLQGICGRCHALKSGRESRAQTRSQAA
jgi:5-methylcytosine-specific restriction endonuclease McrA